jgi:glucose/arabinose dehydrogenase
MLRARCHFVLLITAAAAVALALAPALGVAADSTVLPTEFEATSIGENGFLSKPTAVAFAPDGRVFVLDEGYGLGPGTNDPPQVKVKEPGSSSYKRLFKIPHVNKLQDRGITGMALDKDFGTPGHNYMYLAYTYEPSGGPSESDNARTQRLTRVTVPDVVPSGGPEEPVETVLLGSVGTPVSSTQACPYPKTPGGEFDPNGSWGPFDHTDCIPSDSNEHAIDSVLVDPTDGTLWVSVGDGSEGGDFPDPIAFRSQAIDSLSGKLLHVDQNGKGLPTNGTCPGVTDFDRNCTKVYGRGLRNPFRFSFRPDGKIAVGDVGWKSRDEIDLLSSGGKNFGWPCYEGTVQTPLWKDRPECIAWYAAATPHQAPVYDYAYPPATFGAAVILGPTYTGTGQESDYPDEYSGALFFSDYVSDKVSYLKLDSNGSLVSGYPQPFGVVADAVDWVLAPNGDLVYVDIGLIDDHEPSVRQISAVDNHRPAAKIDLSSPPYGDVPLDEDFDGSGSVDPDPGETATLSYAWDLDGDGEFDDAAVANPPSYEYLDGSQNLTVKLKVTDELGKSDIATTELWPGDNPPTGPTMDPGNPDTYHGGELVDLAGGTSDPDPGDSATLHWSAVINHAGTHLHDLGTGTGGSFSFHTDTTHDQPSTYEVTVLAVDERGLETPSQTLVFQPETSTLSLTSTPSGAGVNHGGVDHVAPYMGKSTIGVQVGISAADSVLSGGALYQFEAWSNGGPRSQTLFMPAGGLTLNARYATTILEPPPPPTEKPPPPPVDTTAAQLLFSSKQGLVKGRKSLLKGTAEDPSGVRQVQVGLRMKKKQRGKCLWWSQHHGAFASRATSCTKPAFMTARLKGGDPVQWTVPLGGKLPSGNYLLVFRTVDGAGNVGGGSSGTPPIVLLVK